VRNLYCSRGRERYLWAFSYHDIRFPAAAYYRVVALHAAETTQLLFNAA
jgi:hypothetical protein